MIVPLNPFFQKILIHSASPSARSGRLDPDLSGKSLWGWLFQLQPECHCLWRGCHRDTMGEGGQWPSRVWLFGTSFPYSTPKRISLENCVYWDKGLLLLHLWCKCVSMIGKNGHVELKALIFTEINICLSEDHKTGVGAVIWAEGKSVSMRRII